MTAEKFEAILSRQVADSEKRARAGYVIDTGKGLENARRQVAEVIAKLTAGAARLRQASPSGTMPRE